MSALNDRFDDLELALSLQGDAIHQFTEHLDRDEKAPAERRALRKALCAAEAGVREAHVAAVEEIRHRHGITDDTGTATA